jgi:hypothetical protein
MVNKFVVVGKVSVISKDNPDYPGFYITPLGEDKLIPVSLRRDEEYLDQIMAAQLKQLNNGMTVGVAGKVDMTIAGIKLRAEKITIISK